MPVPGTIDRRPVQNGDSSPFHDITRLTDEQLKKGANQAVGLFRRSIPHARWAGVCLVEMKKRVKKRGGDWTGWLKENFDGSPWTARLYMRIAKYWDTHLAQHIDQLETLDDCRRLLPEAQEA